MTHGETFRTALLLEGVEAAEQIRKQGEVDVDEVVNGRNALHAACGGGDAIALEYLLGLGASIDCRVDDTWEDGSVGAEHGATPLMLAAGSHMSGSRGPRCLQLLIDSGADLDAQDHAGRTALFYAVKFPRRVRTLLDAGADPDLTDRRGYSVLTLARSAAEEGIPDAELDFLRMASAGEVTAASAREVVDLLEARGAVAKGGDNAALLRAAAAGGVQQVASLLDAGADPDFRDAGTPLTAAASAGHLAVVRLLLDRGADVDGTGSDTPLADFTPLGRAAQSGHLEIVRLLLARGADPSPGPAGMRPIDHARASRANDRGRTGARWDEIIDALRAAADRRATARSLRPGARGRLSGEARAVLAALQLEADAFAEVATAGTVLLEGVPQPVAEISREWPRLVGRARAEGWTLFATARSLDELEPPEKDVLEDAQSTANGAAAAWFAARRAAWGIEAKPLRRLPATLDNAPSFGSVMGRPGPQARLALVRGDIGWAPIFYRFGGWNDCPAPAEHALVLKAWQRDYGVELAYLGHDVIELVREAPLSDRAQIEVLAPEIGLYCSESDSFSDNVRVARSRTWFFWWD